MAPVSLATLSAKNGAGRPHPQEEHVSTRDPVETAWAVTSRLFAFACVLTLTMGAAACGGGDDGGDAAPTTSAGGTSQAGSTPAAESSPSVTPATGSSTAGTPDSDGDISTFSGRLPDLDSYRYSFSLEGTAGLIAEISGSSIPTGVNPNTDMLAFVVEGSYVNPDRGEATISFGDTSLTQIVIGSEVWQDVGDGFKGPADLAASGDADYSFVAAFWDSDATIALEDFSCGNDTVTINGVSTRKCSADSETVERLNQEGKLFTTGILDLEEFETATAELWVTSADKVIRFRAEVAGTDPSGRDVDLKMSVDITDINATFTIDAPF